MNPAVVASLRCPVCGDPVAGERTLRCPGGHSFDGARHGYVDLTGGRLTHAGDTVEMVAARAELLAAGHFQPLTDAIVRTVSAFPPGLVVDVGAGTGHHLAALLRARPSDIGLALDVSKPALRRAARAHPRLAAARADAWRRLPVADGAAGLVLDVFAPRSGPEFHRILRADGALVVVTPDQDHLVELVAALDLLRVDPYKEQRLAGTLERWFTPVSRDRHRWPLHLSGDEAAAAVRMGPSAWHADAGRIAGPVTVTASVVVTLWRPKGDIRA
jgi:23S rRNA (guanine745-N1)-methyltransferase